MPYYVALVYEAGRNALPRLTMFETDDAPTHTLAITRVANQSGLHRREGVFATEQQAKQAIIRGISDAIDFRPPPHTTGTDKANEPL